MNNLFKFQTKVLALTAILLISILSVLSAQKIAIIDAGSSGSRLHVYKLNYHELISLYPSKDTVNGSKGKALSDVVRQKESIKNFLTTMTKKYTNPDNDSISLYVLATAGMRLLGKDTAQLVYDTIMSFKEAFKGYKIENAMTISGKSEGFYAWIAANYKMGYLKIENDSLKKTYPSLDSLYGILEIGGASMQIAFAMDTACDNCISRKGFSNIHSKSYLGGGVNEIFKFPDSLKAKTDEMSQDKNKLKLNNTKFIGLGKPIEVVIDGVSKSNIEDYVKSLENNTDSMENFHPHINARYIKEIAKSWDLEFNKNLIKPIKESDWTEGAALDILINKDSLQVFNNQ